MTAIKPHQIKRLSLSGKTTYEELEEAERNQQRLTDRPATLPLNVLKVAPAVFQWRDLTANEAAEIAHMQELTRVLQESQALDPLLVSAIGAQFFVIDGPCTLDSTTEMSLLLARSSREGSLLSTYSSITRRTRAPSGPPITIEQKWQTDEALPYADASNPLNAMPGLYSQQIDCNKAE